MKTFFCLINLQKPSFSNVKEKVTTAFLDGFFSTYSLKQIIRNYSPELLMSFKNKM